MIGEYRMKDVADIFWDQVLKNIDIESFIDADTRENGIVGMHN